MGDIISRWGLEVDRRPVAAVSDKGTQPGTFYIFAVTNWHVACRGSSVVRLMRKDGTPEIFAYGPEDWFFDQGGPDIAIVPIAAGADHFRKA